MIAGAIVLAVAGLAVLFFALNRACNLIAALLRDAMRP